MVEFALVLPILLVLLLGTVSAGLAWDTKLQVSHATREGARYGVTVPVDQEFDTGSWAENVRNVVVARSAGELTAADVCVALVEDTPPTVWDGDGGFTTNVDGTPCYDDSAVGDSSMRVQVTASTTTLLETGFWSRDLNIDVEATAKHEQDPV